jgi:hypothetical protein
MLEEKQQRTFLVTGSIFLTFINLFTILLLVATEAEGDFIRFAAIGFAISMLLLAFNTTLLCTTQAGQGILKTGRVLLWIGFLLLMCAYVLCIVTFITSG